MGRIIPYMKWNIKFMFETTNQTTVLVESLILAPYNLSLCCWNLALLWNVITSRESNHQDLKHVNV